MEIIDKKASEHPAAGGTVMRPIAKLAKRKKPGKRQERGQK